MIPWNQCRPDKLVINDRVHCRRWASEEMAVSAHLAWGRVDEAANQLRRPLGFHRPVAEIAVKVAAITGPDNLKAFANAIHVCVPSVRLRKPGCAGFSAIGRFCCKSRLC